MSTRKPNSATARLKQDYLRLKKDPVPYVVAEPLPSNILEWYVWHFMAKCEQQKSEKNWNFDVFIVSGIMLSQGQKVHLMKEGCIMGNLCFHENFHSSLLAYTWSLQMEGWYLDYLGAVYE